MHQRDARHPAETAEARLLAIPLGALRLKLLRIPWALRLPLASKVAAVWKLCRHELCWCRQLSRGAHFTLHSLPSALVRAQDTSLDRAEDGPCGSGGGFLAAALACLGTDDTDAATTARPPDITHSKTAAPPVPRSASNHGPNKRPQAIARTAAHRLRRGIWTSSGAGDPKRVRQEHAAVFCLRLLRLQPRWLRRRPAQHVERIGEMHYITQRPCCRLLRRRKGS